MVRKDILEDFVIDKIVDGLSNNETMNYIVQNLLRIQEEQSKENSTLQYLKRELKQTEQSISNIMKAIEQGGTTPTVMNRLRELEEQKENYDKNILLEKSKITIKLTEKEIRGYFRQALKLEPQMLINYLVREITLYDDKMKIQYNNPLQSPDNSQGFLFYNKTVKIPYVIQNRSKPILKDFRLIMSV